MVHHWPSSQLIDYGTMPHTTEGNRILEDLLREPSVLRLFDEK